LPQHNLDFSAVYRRGMASQARDDVNLDDGPIAVNGSLLMHRDRSARWEGQI
jgi:hypothetical protein